MTKLIPLTKGQFAIVDDADYDWLMQWKWYCGNGYAIRGRRENGKRITVFMHRVIINPPSDFQVDHRDGNPLNNQRSNLRIATHYGNMQNRRKSTSSKCKSQYKGVRWRNDTNKWRAAIQVCGKDIYLLSSHSEIECAKAYDTAAKRYFGTFARLNFPEE